MRGPKNGIVLVVVGMGFLLAAALQRGTPASSLRIQTENRFPLVRGINVRTVVSPGAVPAIITDLTRPQEVHRLAGLGFTFVRLPVGPDRIVTPSGALDSTMLAELDNILDQLTTAGVGAIVEIHGDDAFKVSILQTPTSVEQFAALWQKLATHLARRYSPRLLAFEPLNEPFTPRGAAVTWKVAQEILWRTVRRSAPLNMIVLSGGGGSQIEGLERVDPVGDTNVVYTFHFYEPTTFTFQGASWPGLTQRYLTRIRDVPYPASCPAVHTRLEALRGAEPVDSLAKAAAQALQAYAAEGWDRAKVESRISTVTGWAEAHHVKVFAGEIGVMRTAAPPSSRFRWFEDVRRTLDKRGIAWALWEYKGGFGLLRDSGTVDQYTAGALGLKGGAELPRTEPCR